MADLLAMMIASGEVAALPVGIHWPVHRGFLELTKLADLADVDLGYRLTAAPDPDVCLRVSGAEEALTMVIGAGLFDQVGAGYEARWQVVAEAVTHVRRRVMTEDPRVAHVVTQAGQRLATAASTTLKNIDTASASWAPTVASATPAVRQPPLVALR